MVSWLCKTALAIAVAALMPASGAAVPPVVGWDSGSPTGAGADCWEPGLTELTFDCVVASCGTIQQQMGWRQPGTTVGSVFVLRYRGEQVWSTDAHPRHAGALLHWHPDGSMVAMHPLSRTPGGAAPALLVETWAQGGHVRTQMLAPIDGGEPLPSSAEFIVVGIAETFSVYVNGKLRWAFYEPGAKDGGQVIPGVLAGCDSAHHHLRWSEFSVVST